MRVGCACQGVTSVVPQDVTTGRTRSRVAERSFRNRGCKRRTRRQSGYILMVLMIMALVMMIGLTAVAPAIATQIKREREQELMHRGTAYARAIKRFYKRFGRYPTRIEELENTNNIRFLRKRYTDPITGKNEWRLIHFGEAKIVPKTFGN